MTKNSQLHRLNPPPSAAFPCLYSAVDGSCINTTNMKKNLVIIPAKQKNPGSLCVLVINGHLLAVFIC